MNNKKNWLIDLKSRVCVLGIHIASIFIDAVFLSLWVVIQYSVDCMVIKRLELSGIDLWMLRVFQVIFGLSTLAPVIIYIVVDIGVMVIRASNQIKQEKKHNKPGEIDGTNDESRQ